MPRTPVMMLAAAIVLLVCGLVLGAVAIFDLGRSMPTSQTEQQANNQQQPTSQQRATEQPVPENQKEKPSYWTQTKQKIRQGWNRFVEVMEHNDKAVVAISTMVIALFTVFLVCATAALFISSERVAEANKKSTEVANRALVAAQRPWVKADIEPASGFSFGEKEARITFGYSLKNVGNAVATHIQVNVKLIAFQFGKVTGELPNIKIEVPQTRPMEELRKLCEGVAKIFDIPAAASFSGGHILFPGDPHPSAVNVHISNEDIEIARAQSSYRHLIPILLFCVTYRTPFDERTHYTGYAFYIFRHDSSSPGGAREINPDEGNVDHGAISLKPAPFDSGIAN